MSQAGKPKPAFFIAVLAVVAGLCGMAFYQCSAKKKKADDAPIDIKAIKEGAGGSGSAAVAESPDSSTVTTVKEYTFEAETKLPPVPGVAKYAELGKPRVVKFAFNVWAGWAPILWANGGKSAKKVWKDAKGGEFKVEMVLIDNPIDMGNAFAGGNVHIGWATVDMLPLLVQRFKDDPRTMPRVFQQVDWSNGGDGIVVRDNIKSIADLRGKKVAFAQNSPSHYFLLNMLLNGGLQPSEIQPVRTGDAFQAAAAFNNEKDIAAAVSWAPDIYKLAEIKGNRMLVDTKTANKLIADVWFSRADFARDNPEIIEGLVRGILDATTELSEDEAKRREVAKLMDDAYGLPPGTAYDMLGDAHWCNYAENRDFFLNANNPTNFERTYNTAYLLYKAIRAVEDKVPFDQIMDFSVIKKLGKEEKYANQKNTYEFRFAPTATEAINVEAAILTKTVVISFFPNSYDLFKKVPSPSGGEDLYYDPNVEITIEEIAKLAGQYGAARIQIEGHTDASMRGQADESLVRELSQNRANSVKEALVNKFKLQPAQFVTVGLGWSRPADRDDPDNHVKNRRVEVKVIPAEAQ